MRFVLSACLTMAVFTLIAHADSFDDAQKAFREKKYKAAATLLDQHLKTNKKDAKAYRLRGQIRMLQHNLPDALGDLNKAIELEPKKADGYLFRARVHVRQGKFDDARSDFDKAISLAPKVAMAYTERGCVCMDQVVVAKDVNKRKECIDGAAKDFDVAIKLNPKMPRAFAGRAWAKLEAKPVEGIVTKDGKSYLVLMGYRPEVVATCLPDLNKALEMNPKLVMGLLVRAKCYQALKDHAKEIKDRKAAAALTRKHPENLARLAWVLSCSTNEKLRDGKAAVTYAKTAAKLTKNKDPYVLSALAAAHACAGDFKSAIATQKKLITMQKAPPKSSFHRTLDMYKEKKCCFCEEDSPPVPPKPQK